MSSFTQSSHRTAGIITEGEFTLTLQWVPSHCGIPGNEAADRIAEDAHNSNQKILCPLSIEEGKRKVKRAASQAWQLKYNTQKDNTHIGTIKTKIGHWPWASHKIRAAETALTRLRMSHVELNAYLHRFNQSDSPLCHTCRSPETVDHFLIFCRRYHLARRRLFGTLQNKGIAVSKKTLLGGGPYKETEQKIILEGMVTYLKETGRLNGMASA